MDYDDGERDRWVRLADDGSKDPSFASEVAKRLAAELRRACNRQTTRTPDSYLYHPTHKFLARVLDLDVEPLPDDSTIPPTAGVPLTRTGSQPIPIRIPFDCLITGVWGYARGANDTGDPSVEVLPSITAGASDNLDLFSVRWGLNGDTWYSTNGNDELMCPASVSVGTQTFPRPMAWLVGRAQTLNVLFRNISNAFFEDLPPDNPGRAGFRLAEAAIVFGALKLEGP